MAELQAMWWAPWADIEHLLFCYWEGESSWDLISKMEKLMACLKIYETKHSQENWMAPLVISSWVFINFTLAVVITLGSALLSSQCLQKSWCCSQEPWGQYFWGMGVILVSPQRQQLPNKLHTKSFYKIRRNSLSVAMNGRKTVPKRAFHQNSLLLCWFGAEKSELGCSGWRHGNLLHLPSTVTAIFWESAVCCKQLHLGFAPNVLKETHCALSLYLLLHVTI